jgi:ComF family protein
MIFLRSILNLLFPSQCPLCFSHSDNHSHNPICSKCWSTIARYEGPACSICGLPTVSIYTSICAECLAKKPPFSKINCYGIYDGALKESIHLLKFQGVKRLAKPLSELLVTQCSNDYDAVVPVPLHIKKLKEREFNQTALLGRFLSRSINKPLLLAALIKTRETELQTAVSGKERRANLRGAFSISQDISGMRLLLVDDVITTGATVRECAATMKRAGAKEIRVVALARSMPRINT